MFSVGGAQKHDLSYRVTSPERVATFSFFSICQGRRGGGKEGFVMDEGKIQHG